MLKITSGNKQAREERSEISVERKKELSNQNFVSSEVVEEK